MPDAPWDASDLRILDALQRDARLTNQQLAERVHLSPSPCWRRVRRLEASGVVRRYRADLDRQQLGFGVLAFIRVTIDSHNEDEARAFEHRVLALDQVTGCWSIAGEADFLLQVVAVDLDAYADFAMNTVRRLPGIKETHTMFALKELKPPGVLPLPAAVARLPWRTAGLARARGVHAPIADCRRRRTPRCDRKSCQRLRRDARRATGDGQQSTRRLIRCRSTTMHVDVSTRKFASKMQTSERSMRASRVRPSRERRYALSRSPTPGSVTIQRGLAASSPSFWRSFATRMRR